MASITNKVNTKVEVANEIKSFIGGMNIMQLMINCQTMKCV